MATKYKQSETYYLERDKQLKMSCQMLCIFSTNMWCRNKDSEEAF